MKRILSLLSLRPYGNNLLTSAASLWMLNVMIISLVLSIAEAATWGVLAHFLFNNMLIAILCSFAIFCIIWLILVGLTTLNISDTKVFIGLLLRIILVGSSIYISAPFLQQLLLSNEIDKELSHRQVQAVNAVTAKINSSYESQKSILASRLADLSLKLTAELTGKAGSRAYGLGPRAHVIKNEIDSIKEEINRVEAARQRELNSSSTSVLTQLATKYDISIPADTLSTRQKILREMNEKNQSYKAVDLLQKSFLTFFFIALIVLKVFQPRSVAIYFNDRLQELYLRYLSGHFNKYISASERPAESYNLMTPYRFEEWASHSYPLLESDFNAAVDFSLERRRSYFEDQSRIIKAEEQKLDVPECLEKDVMKDGQEH